MGTRQIMQVDPYALERAERRLGILLILPTAAVMGVMILFPFAYAIWLSFFRKSSIVPGSSFVGFDNYIYLFKRGEFWQSFINGTIWTGISVGVTIAIGVALAVLLHQNFRGRSIVRGMILFPYMIPLIVATLLWQWMFNDLYGVTNHFLMSIGLIRTPISWFGNPFYAMVSCILITIWKFFPFVVIVILARLQTIPEELYEAAKVDGASAWQRFWTITLPQLKSVLIIVILLRVLWTYKNFDVIWMLTKGGPLISTQNLPIYAYKTAIPSMLMGRGAAIAVTIFVPLAVLGFLYLRIVKRKE
jgi:multiple sugar transport system permease protein